MPNILISELENLFVFHCENSPKDFFDVETPELAIYESKLALLSDEEMTIFLDIMKKHSDRWIEEAKKQMADSMKPKKRK
jgi:hypothetical protein